MSFYCPDRPRHSSQRPQGRAHWQKTWLKSKRFATFWGKHGLGQTMNGENRTRKPARLSPLSLFEWIDNHPSESRRRITQSLISSLIGATILSVVGLAWTRRHALVEMPQRVMDFLKSSIEVELWILLLVLVAGFGAAWFIHWIRAKNKIIAELQAKVQKLTPQTNDKVPSGADQPHDQTKNPAGVPPPVV